MYWFYLLVINGGVPPGVATGVKLDVPNKLHKNENFNFVVKTVVIQYSKTFPENWDSKVPSIGTLLAYVMTMA